ncbi:hypothetical protein BE17_05115 [Sorangium cellulosum]|uniref:Uncharacterized protein n=1 Tax=Sorangium cellulosum TaxID=56 RepID=A0A150R6C5_SORCE|nr:hypothetical protein BE17_05115 [Sorangium cellulosum]
MPVTFVETRLVVLLAFDGVSLLDLAGPLEALTVAATFLHGATRQHAPQGSGQLWPERVHMKAGRREDY